MTKNYFYKDRAGAQNGPVSFLELLTLIKTGRIAPDCLVWNDSGAPRQAGSIEELFDVFQSKASFAVPAGSGPLAPNLPAWGLFWRAVVYSLGLALIVPAPWAGKWFHGWIAERICLPNRKRLFLETSLGACWFIFVAIGLAAIAPPLFHGHSGVQIIANLVSLFAGFLLTGWFSRSLRSEDGALNVAFQGGFLPYFGWCLLIGLSLVTIIGWAWVVKYWMRWIFRETRGSHSFEFVATGWDILWRTLVVILGCMLIVTIPWLVAWIYNWYISRIVVTPDVTMAAEQRVAA
jgi:hypothetical protein